MRLFDSFSTARTNELKIAIGLAVEPPFWVRRGLRVMGGIALAFLIFLFLPWTQNITGVGRVTSLSPDVRPQTLHAMIPGRILRWYVQEGERVQAGETLLVIGEIKDYYLDPALPLRLREQLEAKQNTAAAQREKIRSLEQQVTALREAYRNSLERARNALVQSELRYQADSAAWEAAKVEAQLAESQYVRQESLYVQGLRSLTEFQQRKQRYQDAQARLLAAQNRLMISRTDVQNARIQIDFVTADYREKIAKAESDLQSAQSYLYEVEGSIAKLRNEITNVEQRWRFHYVTAPQQGYIVRAVRTGVGEVIKEGEPLAVFMPANYKLAAELFVRPLDAALLKPGKEVRLQFDGWPAFVFSGWPQLSYGTFGGRIYTIDYVDNGTGYFRVLVEPNPTEDKPWPSLLRMGGGVRGWFLLEDVPIWYEIWRQINGFPPDMTAQFYQTKASPTK